MNLIERIDLHGRQFNLNINGKLFYQTYLGGLLSLLFLSFCIVAACLLGRDIIYHEGPFVSTTKYNLEDSNITNFSVNNFFLAIRMETESSHQTIDDNRYVNYILLNMNYTRNKTTNDTYRTSLTRVMLSKCDNSHIANEYFDKYPNLRDYYCANVNGVKLGGDFSISNFISVVSFRILKCSKEAQVMFNLTCLTNQEIKNKYSSTRVSFYLLENIVNPPNYVQPLYKNLRYYYTNFSPDSKKKENIVYKPARLITDNGWIFANTSVQEFYEYESKTNDVTTFEGDYSKLEYVFEFQLSRILTEYTRSYVKLQGIAALVGGLANFIYAVVNTAYYLHWYNDFFLFMFENLLKIEMSYISEKEEEKRNLSVDNCKNLVIQSRILTPNEKSNSSEKDSSNIGLKLDDDVAREGNFDDFVNEVQYISFTDYKIDGLEVILEENNNEGNSKNRDPRMSIHHVKLPNEKVRKNSIDKLVNISPQIVVPKKIYHSGRPHPQQNDNGNNSNSKTHFPNENSSKSKKRWSSFLKCPQFEDKTIDAFKRLSMMERDVRKNSIMLDVPRGGLKKSLTTIELAHSRLGLKNDDEAERKFSKDEGFLINKDIGNIIKENQKKRSEIKVMYIENFILNFLFCYGRSIKFKDSEYQKLRFKLISAANDKIMRKTDIVSIIKSLDQFKLLNKIVLNQSQGFMLKNIGAEAIINKSSKYTDKELFEEKFEKGRKSLISYIKDKREVQDFSEVDQLLYDSMDEKFKKKIEKEIDPQSKNSVFFQIE